MTRAKTLIASGFLALALPAGLILPTSEVAAQAAAQATPGSLALGVEIATLLNSEEITLSQAKKLFDETMPAAFAKEPGFAALEAEFPGVIDEVLTAIRPELEKQVIDSLPDLWGRLGAAYAGSLTDAEMRQMLAFYRSDTGRWLIDQIATNADFSSLLDTMIRNSDTNVVPRDLNIALQKPVLDNVARTMTRQREADLRAMLATSAGRKIGALNPKLLAIATEWTNEPDPEGEKRIDAIMEAVLGKYIDADAPKAERT